MHRGKVDPGVSELPRGNEFSRDHVNRPKKHVFNGAYDHYNYMETRLKTGIMPKSAGVPDVRD